MIRSIAWNYDGGIKVGPKSGKNRELGYLWYS